MMYCKYIPCVIIISVTPIAAYKAALRVQSERSERLRELPSAGTHRELTPAARRRGLYFLAESSLLNEAVNVSTGEPFSTKIQIGTDIDVENSVVNQIAISAE